MAEIILREYPAFGEKYYIIRSDGLPEIYLIPKKRSTAYAILRVGMGGFDRIFRENGKTYPVYPGTAHFIEHKIFANPDGTDAMESMQALGADLNAYTSATSTCYLFNCHDRVGDALRELLTFVSTPFFTPENVALEREIILQEEAMYQDSPQYVLEMRALRQLYDRHPIRDEIVGPPGSIRRMTAGYLSRVYRAFYHVSNMTLFVAGDLTPDDVLSALDGVRIPSHSGFERIEPEKEEGERLSTFRTCRRQVSKPIFAVSGRFPVPKGPTVEQYKSSIAVDLLNQLLFSDSGKLYQSLRDDGLLTAPLSGVTVWETGCHYAIFSGESNRPRKVKDAIARAMKELLENGVDESDFLRLLRADYASDVGSFDSIESLCDAFCRLVPDGGLDPYEQTALTNELTLEYVNRVLRESFSPDALHLTVIRPIRQNDQEWENIEE